jgi:ubiquinone/menaquinone biosynthesis C-methylase UbiE
MPEMMPKPKHLGPEYASQFADPAVVAAYHHRPPYAAAVFPALRDLAIGEPRVVLDLGCGTGDIARPLAGVVDFVDAVDCSAAMIERGRTLPGGEAANLRWILGYAEEVLLPHDIYGLVTAGESLHWMDWARLMPRLAALLASGAYLAVVERSPRVRPVWFDEVQRLIERYTTNREYQPYSLINELRQRGVFEQSGVESIEPVHFEQSVDSYIESIHSRNGFSRDRMTHQAAAEFDAGVRRVLEDRCPDDTVQFDMVGRIIYGRPIGTQKSELRSQTTHAPDSSSVCPETTHNPAMSDI